MATKHLQMTIGYARQAVARDVAEGRYPRLFTNADGTRPTVDEMYAALDEMDADGFEVVPCGCQVDDRGRCLGIGA